MNNPSPSTHRHLLNIAPALVAWGLEHGLLSLKPRWKHEEPGYLDKRRDEQREYMRRLRARMAAAASQQGQAEQSSTPP